MNDGAVRLCSTRFGNVQYCVVGEGRPVLIAHGSGGGHDQGCLIAHALLTGGRVIAVSRFGYLASDLPADPSNRNQAEVYRRILEAEALAGACIMGVSAGGPSALEFAVNYPDSCHGLILISAVSQPQLQAGIRVHPLLRALAGSDPAYTVVTTLFRRRLLAMFGLSRRVAARLTAEERAFSEALFRTTMPVSRRIDGIVNDWHLPTMDELALRQLRVPALVIHACDDQLVPLENAEYNVRTIPGAQPMTISDGGHLLFSHHRAVRERISRFLDQEVPDVRTGPRDRCDDAGRERQARTVGQPVQ